MKPGYKQSEVGVIPEDWKAIDLLDLCTLQRGFDITEATRAPGTVPVYSSSGLSYFHNQAMVAPPGVVTGRKGLLGKVFVVNEPFWPHDTTLWVRDFKGNHPAYVALVLENFHLERLDAATSVPTLNRNSLAGHIVPIPATNAEQEVIADSLADADAFIESLEHLLAKKRDLKQASMQSLLTGKRRLPGFSGEWETRALGEFATANKGSQLHSSSVTPHGMFIHLNGGMSPSGYTDKANALGDTIAISEGGNSCGYVQFMSEPYWCGGHCYSVTPQGMDNRFLYHALKAAEPSIMSLRVGSGLPNVQKTALLAFKLRSPKASDEQTAISTILSDMDTEIVELEAKRSKARNLKQGMTHELLTGRVRLI